MEDSKLLDAVFSGDMVPCPHYDPDNIAHCELQRPTVTLCSGYLVLDGVKCPRYNELMLRKTGEADSEGSGECGASFYSTVDGSRPQQCSNEMSGKPGNEMSLIPVNSLRIKEAA